MSEKPRSSKHDAVDVQTPRESRQASCERRARQIAGTGWKPPIHARNEDLRGRQTVDEWREVMTIIGRDIGEDMTSAQMYPSGSDVVFGNGSIVVKLTHPRWRDDIETEVILLDSVAGKIPHDTPRPLHHGTVQGWPFLVMSRTDGESVRDVWPRLSADERLDVAGQIGEMTRCLHQIELPPVRLHWTAWLSSLRASAKRRHAGSTVPAHLLDQVDAFVDGLTAADTPLAFVHTEIYEDHVLLRRGAESRWHIAALIDFADARVGHPHYDLPACVELMFRADASSLRAFLLGYGFTADEINDELACNLLRWSLIHRFGSLARWLDMVPGSEPADLRELAFRVVLGRPSSYGS